jgi:hypothetical protein
MESESCLRNEGAAACVCSAEIVQPVDMFVYPQQRSFACALRSVFQACYLHTSDMKSA